MQPLTFAPTYPGAQITVALLGMIEVGRIHTEGKRASWMCHLPPAWACQWHMARNEAEATAALEARVARWIEEAGLTRQAQRSNGPPASAPPRILGATGQHDDSTGGAE